MDFAAIAQNLIRGSAADLAAARKAMEQGRAVAMPTASSSTLALAQKARDTGDAGDYEAARRAGEADRAASGAGMSSGMSLPVMALGNAHKAAVSAEAQRIAIENSRANCFVALQTATPTVAIGAGASSGIMTVSLPGSTEIVAYTASPVDTAFVLTSLQVNAWETNKGGFGICLDNFTAATRRDSQLAPLVGREWDGTITISGQVTNISGAGAVFHGLGILARNEECHSSYKKSQPGGHFVPFGELVSASAEHLGIG